MISQSNVDNTVSVLNTPQHCQYYGLSTDSKPTDAANGSAFIEMDTGKVYFFDRTNMTWREFNA